MYYSLTISDGVNEINTYDDWGIIPTERPSFSPPSFDMKTIEIPGKSGLLDTTTALTKLPTFGNRAGSLEFLIHPESKMTWYETYSKVANFLHGQTKKVSLEDDPAYWYEGRFWVDSFKSGKNYSTITIQYSLEPYKKSKWTTLENWPIDPFKLNVVDEGEPLVPRYISDWYYNLGTNQTDSWKQVFNSNSFPDGLHQAMIGSPAAIPTIIVTTTESNGIDIWFENDELGIYYVEHIPEGRNTNTNIIFSMNNPSNGLRIAIKGNGRIDIEHTIRSL